MFKRMAVRLLFISALVLLLSVTLVSAQDSATTEVGTPRNQTLIMDALDGRVNNPTQMNPYLQSTLMNEGLNQLAYSALWEMNTVTGQQFPALAAAMPEVLDKDYKDFKITLREGMSWSDGQAITADDLVYTIQTVMATSAFPFSGYLNSLIDSVAKLDDYSVELKTKES